MRTTLKDGTRADIREWDVYALHEALKRVPVTDSPKVYQDFGFTSPRLVNSMLDAKDDPDAWERAGEVTYAEERDLSPLEQQVPRHLPNHAYSRGIVAIRPRFLRSDELIGIALLEWQKGNWFWHYGLALDVHARYRNKGVGTALLRAVDKAQFVKGKILSVGSYTAEGQAYIAPRIEGLLTGRDYALITGGVISSIPTMPGIYQGPSPWDIA